MDIKNKFLKYFLFNLLCFSFALVLVKGQINSVISPFFSAFIFSLVALKIDVKNFIFGAFLAGISFNFTIVGFAIVLVSTIIILILNILLGKVKGFYWLTMLGLVASSSFELLFYAQNAYLFVLALINIILKIIIFYVYYVLFRKVIIRGVKAKFLMDEFIGVVFLMMPISITIFSINLFGVNVGFVVTAFVIVMASVVLGSLESIILAVIIGLGVSVKTGNIMFVSSLSLWASGASIVKSSGRVIMGLVVVIIDLILGLYFNVYLEYTKFNLYALCVSFLLIAVFPRKVIKKLKNYFGSDSKELSTERLYDLKEGKLVKKIEEMGKLFYEIHMVYDNLVIGSLNKKEVQETIKRSIINKNCMNCVKRQFCYDKSDVAINSIKELVKIGANKNIVRVVDVPIFLAKNCGKTNQMIYAVNAYLEEFNKYNKEIKREDEGKLMVSNQLLGISDILKGFAVEDFIGERASKEKEQALIDALLYNNVVVRECAIFNIDDVLNRVILVVRANKYKKEYVLNEINKFFKEKLEIKEIKYASKRGFNVITFERVTRFKYDYGFSVISKENKCGDVVSRVELDNKKIIFTLADGKGHGATANKLSAMTLSLIENFYRVGYNSNVIIDNVNKVLSFKGLENFSAVDVCALNLENGGVDFIKRGGTPSVIKSSNGECYAVCGSNLPIGLIENAKTDMITKYLSRGDIVVLSSDGVFDAFSSLDEYKGFINNINESNLNKLCEKLIQGAVKLNNGEVKDDMSAIAFKVI